MLQADSFQFGQDGHCFISGFLCRCQLLCLICLRFTADFFSASSDRCICRSASFTSFSVILSSPAAAGAGWESDPHTGQGCPSVSFSASTKACPSMKIRFRQSQFFFVFRRFFFSAANIFFPEAVPPPFVSPRIFRPDVPLLFSQSRRNEKDSDTAQFPLHFNPFFLRRFFFSKAQELAPPLPLPFLLQADRRLLFQCFRRSALLLFAFTASDHSFVTDWAARIILYARAAFLFFPLFFHPLQCRFRRFQTEKSAMKHIRLHHRRVKDLLLFVRLHKFRFFFFQNFFIDFRLFLQLFFRLRPAGFQKSGSLQFSPAIFRLQFLGFFLQSFSKSKVNACLEKLFHDFLLDPTNLPTAVYENLPGAAG